MTEHLIYDLGLGNITTVATARAGEFRRGGFETRPYPIHNTKTIAMVD